MFDVEAQADIGVSRSGRVIRGGFEGAVVYGCFYGSEWYAAPTPTCGGTLPEREADYSVTYLTSGGKVGDLLRAEVMCDKCTHPRGLCYPPQWSDEPV